VGKRVREKQRSQEGEEARSWDKDTYPKQAKDPEAHQLLLLYDLSPKEGMMKKRR